MENHIITQFDEITGGYTREGLKIIYEKIVLKNYQNYSFITMNIKDFRYLNFLFGYDQANRILKIIYDCICRHVNEASYVARSEGDKFDILINDNSKDSILKNFLSPFVDDLFDFKDPMVYQNIYTSTGIYQLVSADENFQIVQDKAEIARIECREIKRRSFSYDFMTPEKFDHYLAQNSLKRELTRARLGKEFVPFIQPKIDLKTKSIIGGEILMRWIKEDGTVLPLSDYFNLLNEFGEIYLIDMHLFDLICKWLNKRLKNNEIIVPLSFNITNRAFFDINFSEDYLKIFRQYDIPKNLIEFEFMEDIQYGLTDQVIETMGKLKAEGFKCSLDDFGSGYSSFNVLLKSKVDMIKLDRMFFQNPLTEDYKKMLQHIILAVKAMNVKVLAEGVETKEYVDFLESAGCDFVQGFYFYKPMPLADFQKLIDEQKITSTVQNLIFN